MAGLPDALSTLGRPTTTMDPPTAATRPHRRSWTVHASVPENRPGTGTKAAKRRISHGTTRAQRAGFAARAERPTEFRAMGRLSSDTLSVHDFRTLCHELDRLAIATWDLVDQSHNQRVALREDALTSVNLIHLKRGHHPGFCIETFTPVIERANGADFEWWIGSRGEGWLGLRVQAKREYHRNYPDVVYTPTKGGPTQCDSLIQTVRAEALGRALYPFYCFYNGWDGGTGWPTDVDWSIGCSTPANCATVPDVKIFGCGLAPADAVWPLLAPYTRRRWHKLLALQFPWSWLFWTPWYGPIGSMAGIQAGLHAMMAQVAGDDSAVQQRALYRELPGYVIAAQEGIESAQPAPAKRLLVTDIRQASDRG